jgi:hypothetical protein
LAAIKGDMGEALLLSLLANQSRTIDERLDAKSSVELATLLSVRAEEDDSPLVLITDCIAAFDAFVRLKKNASVHVDVIQPSDMSFSFSLAIMLRREDADVAALLEKSQRQLLRTPWRALAHVRNLIKDIESWLDDLPLDEAIAQQWPENVHAFQLDPNGLDRYVEDGINGVGIKQISGMIRHEVEKSRSSNFLLKRLMGFVDS